MGEFFGEHGVGRYFAHHVNLQASFSADQAVLGEQPHDFVGFIERAAKRHHNDHVFQPVLIPHTLDRFAFEPEAVAVLLVVIT